MINHGRWQQLVYGKLVAVPHGPIVSSTEEHRHTGRSQGFPAALDALCRPHQIGLGTDDLYNWRQHPWRRYGGVVSQIVPDGQGYWRVAGRIRARPELSDTDVTQRDFVQGHYLALPWRDWSPGMMLGLARCLNAEPMTETDMRLPTIAIEDADMALPARWLERPLVEAMLSAIMSGHSLAVIDRDLGVEDFLILLNWCIEALPADLAAVLPFGSGLAQVQGHIAVGHGERARVVLSFAEGALKGAADIDLTLGETYVELLRETVADALSTHEVRRRIAHLPELAIAGRPLMRPWTESARAVSGMLVERRRFVAFKRWLAEDPPAPRPALEFQHLRKPVLAALLGTPRGFDLIDQTESWTEAWDDFRGQAPAERAEFVEAIAVLVRNEFNTDLRVLQPLRHLALPRTLASRAVAILDQHLDRQTAPATWLDWNQPGQADWIHGWRGRAAGRLLLLALPMLDPATPKSPGWELAQALGDTPPGAAFAWLMSAAAERDSAHEHTLLDLGANMTAKDLPALLSLFGCAVYADRMEAASDLARHMERLHAGEWRDSLLVADRLPRLAPRIVKYRFSLLGNDRVMTEIVLRGWQYLDADLQSRIAPTVAMAIGQPYAEVLIDQAGVEGGALSTIARDCLDWTNQQHRERTIRWMIDNPDATETHTLLPELMVQLQTITFAYAPPGIIGLLAIASLIAHGAPSLQAFARKDYGVLGRYMRSRGQRAPWPVLMRAVSTVDQLCEVLQLLPDAAVDFAAGSRSSRMAPDQVLQNQVIIPDKSQRTMVLTSIADQPSLLRRLRDLTQQKNLDRAPFWRLLHGRSADQTDLSAFEGLIPWRFVSLAARGVTVPHYCLYDIQERHIAEAVEKQVLAEPDQQLGFVVKMLEAEADMALSAWLLFHARHDKPTRHQIIKSEARNRLGVLLGSMRRAVQRPQAPRSLNEAVVAVLGRLPPQLLEGIKIRLAAAERER